MHFTSTLLAAVVLPSLAAAWAPPEYPGFRLVSSDAFEGFAGSPVDASKWEYVTEIQVNNELQKYTTDGRNVQLSGGGTLQLVPWKDANGQWTSGRVEAKSGFSFTPADGAVTISESMLRFGGNDQANKQGIWPAFWLLGESIRNGVNWPECGEIDILEAINGAPQGHGTIHCDKFGGGACNTPTGISAATALPDQTAWQKWRVQFDRTNPDWRQQSITWSLDEKTFHQVTGERIGDQKTWANLAQSGMYFILNVAVGGTLPGNPNDATLGGYGSMMEVAYVAVYSSK
ncbi:beta-glucanase [Plectosphaerella plurivora]|uniref:Beta-glucanase n=1 Tax=Plectosphaerella plurivora TaxID=936078 RepID=A0A9P9ABX7_9PEZI|nr:beta-glucanase [Plectosphaerella plurivora]